VSEPIVTVVMSVHNAAATVTIALRSILYQTFENWELVVMDDGSTDQTREIVSQIKDPRIRFIREPFGNVGLAVRLNQCISLSRGRYIARMDADDVAYPDRLERQVRFLHEHPEIDLLGTGAAVFTENGKLFGLYPTAYEHEDICRRPWWGFPLAHPTWMGRKTWFVSRPYREGHTRCEDQDLLLRSFSTSRFAALEEVLLGYRMEGISAKNSWRGRLNYCRQLIRQVHDIPSAVTAVRGMMVHSLAFSRDVLLDVTGTLNRRSRLSFQPANDQVRTHWQRVWNRVTSEDAFAGEPAPRRA